MVKAAVKEANSNASRASAPVKPDWGRLSMYAHDFPPPVERAYKRERAALDIKAFIRASHVPFSDPRKCPTKSVAQQVYDTPQFTSYHRQYPRQKDEIRVPFAVSGNFFDGLTEYKQEMTGEMVDKNLPFSPANYPFEMVISPGEVLYSAESRLPDHLRRMLARTRRTEERERYAG